MLSSLDNSEWPVSTSVVSGTGTTSVVSWVLSVSGIHIISVSSAISRVGTSGISGSGSRLSGAETGSIGVRAVMITCSPRFRTIVHESIIRKAVAYIDTTVPLGSESLSAIS